MAIFTIEGEEMIKKTVGDGGDSGRIYVPKSWLGETVQIVRLSRKETEGGEKGVQGEKEETREQGEKGVRGETGEKEETGEQGVNSA